jgi:hypothetical protein
LIFFAVPFFWNTKSININPILCFRVGISVSSRNNSKNIKTYGKGWIRCSICGAKVKKKNLAHHKLKMHPAFYQTPRGKAAIVASIVAFLVVVAALLSYYQPWSQNQEDQLFDNEDLNNVNGSDDITFNRTVLIETFTSVDCSICNAEEEPALKQIALNYSRDEVIILAYHGFFGNDPWQTEKGDDRADYYGGVIGTPDVWFDGTLNKAGGTGDGVDAMYDVYADLIDQRAPINTQVHIEIDGEISGSKATIPTMVNYTGNESTSNLFLRFALIEDGLTHDGKTYDWVMRDYSERWLSGVTFPYNVQKSFNLDSSWNWDNLRAIAWVQDDADKEVSQAIYFDFNQ